MKNCKAHFSRRALSLLLALVLCLGMFPLSASADQSTVYHDPAEHWIRAMNRTNELNVNAVVVQGTSYCNECKQLTPFHCFRTPEYTRDGQTALARNIMYSDGTMRGGEEKGTILGGVPGVDAYYTGYHYTKSVCDICGTINSNMGKGDYCYGKDVFYLYDCATEFFEELPEAVSYTYTDNTYHTKTVEGGTYCGFCFGTRHEHASTLERHNLVTEITPQIGNQRFMIVKRCADCGYEKTSYVTAKSVIASYYGVVDGQPHTLTTSDLSESGVTTSIRYGNSAESCTLSSAPNFTTEGQNTVYYQITYNYGGEKMVENGVAYVWLREETVAAKDTSCACGCGDKNCGCASKDCDGKTCCTDKGCGKNHRFVLLDTVSPTCTTLGYSRYLCSDCGAIEKRDYTNAIGHAYQSILIREADCETEGKVMEICRNCGDMKVTVTPKGEHSYKTYTVKATCTSPGYTVKECDTCGDRQITNITPALPHDYEAHVIPATCETDGQTIYVCHGCGSSFVAEHTHATGHKWDEGTKITSATCNGQGVTQYTCLTCGETRLEAVSATGHNPGPAATCTQPQLCVDCGAVLEEAHGHDYKAEVTAATCLKMGYTTYTCADCGASYKTDYTDPLGHDYRTTVTEPTCTEHGYTTHTCSRCGDSYTTDYTEPLGHEWDEGTTLIETSCNGRGLIDHRCVRCDYHYLEPVSPKGHNPGAEATCTEPQLCLDCGAVLAAPLGHVYKAEVTAPTCEEMGYTTYTCSRCGDSYTTDYTDPTGHKAGDWIVDVEPTTKAEGSRHKECEYCGEIMETESIEKLPLIVPHTAYIVGYPDGTFGPGKSMTRSEAAAIFARLLADKNGDAIRKNVATKFEDVAPGAWYAGYVRYLSGYRIIYGVGGDLFAPNREITRAEFTAMAVRFFREYAGTEATGLKANTFDDVSRDSWAYDVIEAAAAFGWVKGYGDDTFKPGQNITRAEAVAIVNRMLGRSADKDYITENRRTIFDFSDMSPKHWAYWEVMEAANPHTAAVLNDSESWKTK